MGRLANSNKCGSPRVTHGTEQAAARKSLTREAAVGACPCVCPGHTHRAHIRAKVVGRAAQGAPPLRCQVKITAYSFFKHLFIYWARHKACTILVPQPGIEPMPPCCGILTTGLPGNSPRTTASNQVWCTPLALPRGFSSPHLSRSKGWMRPSWFHIERQEALRDG